MSEEPVSSVPSRLSSSIGSVNFSDLLKDESTKKILQTCANSWLCTQSLLCGNLVDIPILSELCFFYVTRGDRLPSDGSNQDPVNQRSFDLHPTASDFADYMHDAYVVHLYLPLGLRTESPEKRFLPGLQLKFENAKASMVFIDELDAIAPSGKDGSEELSRRMVDTLLNLMDGVRRNDGVLVIAATNRPDSIEPALRRPGKLDREIEIGLG